MMPLEEQTRQLELRPLRVAKVLKAFVLALEEQGWAE